MNHEICDIDSSVGAGVAGGVRGRYVGFVRSRGAEDFLRPSTSSMEELLVLVVTGVMLRIVLCESSW